MLTLQEHKSIEIASVQTSTVSLDKLLTKEWLLTNNRGGFSSSTIIGCNTRRYHGLLTGSLNPPVERIMALSNCLESVTTNGKIFEFSTFEFPEKFTPQGFNYLKRFRQDIGAHFDYQFDSVELTKSIYLSHGTDTVALVYDFTNVGSPIDFILRPLIGLRDFHSLQKSSAQLWCAWLNNDLVIGHKAPQTCELYLNCPSMTFQKNPQWWYNFHYRVEKERGQDFNEDLWAPGYFNCHIEAPAKIVFWASLRNNWDNNSAVDNDRDIEALCLQLQARQVKLIGDTKAEDKNFRKLCLACDQFIAKRHDAKNHKTTILAGFPWFADWGRDAFISLPGLLLSTRRFEEAKSVLTTFAAAADEGMIPNCFDDRSNTAHFNSIDASLWFINAAFQYLNITGDSQTFIQNLLPVIRWIIESYHNGTKFGIHADTDGLITGGSGDTQLTWMDAKYQDTVFTPRFGKAVEVNSLWYNCLCRIAEFYAETDTEKAQAYYLMADKVGVNFGKMFWNEKTGFLNDCILPDGTADTSLRPNQIFAIALPFSPLVPKQQKAVLAVVQKELLTPYGLRTLNKKDVRYQQRYSGALFNRDRAYHQGTVWPYLIGPFVEAYLRINEFSDESKKEAASFIEPLLHHMTEDACLGQVSEIFDADPPHNPKGCFAQAWSVAELIRVYQLING